MKTAQVAKFDTLKEDSNENICDVTDNSILDNKSVKSGTTNGRRSRKERSAIKTANSKSANKVPSSYLKK